MTQCSTGPKNTSELDTLVVGHLLLDIRTYFDSAKVKKQMTKFGISYFSNNILSKLISTFTFIHK